MEKRRPIRCTRRRFILVGFSVILVHGRFRDRPTRAGHFLAQAILMRLSVRKPYRRDPHPIGRLAVGLGVFGGKSAPAGGFQEIIPRRTACEVPRGFFPGIGRPHPIGPERLSPAGRPDAERYVDLTESVIGSVRARLPFVNRNSGGFTEEHAETVVNGELGDARVAQDNGAGETGRSIAEAPARALVRMEGQRRRPRNADSGLLTFLSRFADVAAQVRNAFRDRRLGTAVASTPLRGL